MSLLSAVKLLQRDVAARIGRSPRFVFMTPEAQDELIDELEHLELLKRPTAVATLDTLQGMRVGVRPYGVLGYDIYITDRTDA